MSLLRSDGRLPTIVACALGATLLGASAVLIGVCGPFTDVAADSFCPFVQEVFYLGVTTGTSPTTYDPASNMTRLQMAAFLSRSVDGVLKRGSRRAALDQFWTTQNGTVIALTTIGAIPLSPKCDGSDIWVAANPGGTVSRVRASDGKLLETWTGAQSAWGVLVAMGRILVTGQTSPGKLYLVDPSQAAGAVTTVASNLGNGPLDIAFDGARVWTVNSNAPGSVSIVTPGATTPWTVTTVTTGFSQPEAALFDGANVWVTVTGTPGKILKLDSAGAILQTVTVMNFPGFPAFDGANIWVPNYGGSVSVVRASNGVVLQTLTGNGLNSSGSAAFDGQLILVTNLFGDSVSLWKAADLTPIGTFDTGAMSHPGYACSDGVNFWITLQNTGQLARF